MKHGTIKRVFIFEPCLGTLTGHWESNCRRFSDELSRREIEVKIFCQINPDPNIINGLNVIPVFSHHSFADISTTETFDSETARFTKDYASIDKRMFKHGDLLLFTTVMPHSHKATMGWLADIIRPTGPKAAFIFMIGAGDFKDNYQKNKLLLALSRLPFLRDSNLVLKPLFEWKDSIYKTHYRTYIDQFSRKKEEDGYYYFGGCKEYSINFQSLFNVKVRTLPFPTVVKDLPLKEPNNGNELTIGYFGHASLEKGAQFLSHIVKNTLKKYPNVKFILHINPNIHTEEILKEFNVPIPNVTCYHGHLDHEELSRLIFSADINLLPYAPVKYAGLPSMVLTDAICAASVVVTPQYTWLSRTVEKIKMGHVSFANYTAESITNSLCKAIKHYKKLRQKTKPAREKFLKTNNVANYIDEILKVI